MTARILVLGGGGFIGSFVTDCLLEKGYSVRIFEDYSKPLYRQFGIHENIEWTLGDFTNPDNLKAALNDVDAVVHLISTTVPSTSNADPVHDVQTNIVGTINLLKTMISCGVSRIIFVSSGGTVYGLPKCLPIDETHPTNPIVAYGISKLSIEKYMLMFQYSHSIRTTILRVSNPFGERQKSLSNQGVVAAFIRQILLGQDITIWGDGTNIRDYIYVRDVACAFANALEYKGDHHIFNIGSGVGTSLNELLNLLSQEMNVKVRPKYVARRGFDVPSNVLDNGLATRELNWKPSTPLREGLVRTITWIEDEEFGKQRVQQ